jgi:hypothetical protein
VMNDRGAKFGEKHNLLACLIGFVGLAWRLCLV